MCFFFWSGRARIRGRSAGGARAERGRSAGGARKRSDESFLMIPFALCETTATHAPLQTTGRTARPSGVSRSCRGRVVLRVVTHGGAPGAGRGAQGAYQSAQAAAPTPRPPCSALMLAFSCSRRCHFLCRMPHAACGKWRFGCVIFSGVD